MYKCTSECDDENCVPVKSLGADYNTNRAMAGYIRNEELTNYGEALIAVSTSTAGP
jgi:hypothetical protein